MLFSAGNAFLICLRHQHQHENNHTWAQNIGLWSQLDNSIYSSPVSDSNWGILVVLSNLRGLHPPLQRFWKLSIQSASPNSAKQNGAPKFRFEIGQLSNATAPSWYSQTTYPCVNIPFDILCIRLDHDQDSKSICLQMKQAKSHLS